MDYGGQRSGRPAAAGSTPVYQIDFTAVASGKRIASTKRRVRWRFGFTNQDALAAGETGTACRGEEHDITLVWSITSGKRLLLADGQEVHYSNSRSQVFEFSWTMRGNHVLKVVAYATPPMGAAPGFRQYDFFIDGQSFFSLPKVYRLGLRGGPQGAGPVGSSAMTMANSSQRYSNYSAGASPRSGTGSDSNIAAIEAPHNPDEEKAYLEEAIKQSLKDAPAPGAAVNGTAPAPKKEENLLLDFFDEPAVPAPAPPPAASSTFPALPASTPVASFSAAPQPAMSDITASFGAPAPSPGFAQPPPAPAALVGQYGQPPAGTFGFDSPAPAPAPQPAPAPAYQQQQPQLSMFSAPAPPPAASADQAYQNLASMNDFNLVSKTEASNPFAAAPAAPQPTLGDMKASQTAPKQNVMNAPPPGAPGGALVVSGNQTGNWGGALGQTGAPANQAPAMGSQYGAPAPAPGAYGYPAQQQQPPVMGSQLGGSFAAPAPAAYGGYGAQQQPAQYQPQQQQQQPQYAAQPQQGFGAPQYPQQF